jgi:hypothetical protein
MAMKGYGDRLKVRVMQVWKEFVKERIGIYTTKTRSVNQIWHYMVCNMR